MTPHHLQFRSLGGPDTPENTGSLCTWCHLFGVHEGRLGAEPPATTIRWRVGRVGLLRVEGRRVLRGAGRVAQACALRDRVVV